MSRPTATLDPDRTQALLERWADMQPPVLTIQMPLQPAGPEVAQNEIRRKNARRAAENQLAGLDEEALAAAFGDRLALLDEADLENIGPDTRGAVWFLSGERADLIWTPHAVEEHVTLAPTAGFGALLPLLDGVDAFHVLALSEDTVRLLRGSETNLEEVELADVASSLEDERWMDDFETSLQWHVSARGSDAVVHHGHGGASEHDETRKRQFLLAVARAVHAWRRRQPGGVPFAIAAVERTASGFVEAHADAPAPDLIIEGNPDELADDVLHARVLAGLREHGDARREQLAAARAAARAEDLLCEDAGDIARHASLGRVASLHVRSGARIPAALQGPRDDGTPTWVAADDGEANLADVCIAHTLQQGGAIHVLPDTDGGAGRLEAILRY